MSRSTTCTLYRTLRGYVLGACRTLVARAIHASCSGRRGQSGIGACKRWLLVHFMVCSARIVRNTTCLCVMLATESHLLRTFIGAGQVRPHGQKRGYRPRQQAKKFQAAISRAILRGCNHRHDFRVVRIIAAWCIMVYHSEHVYGLGRSQNAPSVRPPAA